MQTLTFGPTLTKPNSTYSNTLRQPKQHQSTADLIWPWKEPVDGTAINQCREHSHSYPRHRKTWDSLGGNYLASFLLSLLPIVRAVFKGSICTWKIDMILQGSKALLHCEVYWSKIDWFFSGISILMCGDTWQSLKSGSVNHILEIDWTWFAYFCCLFLWETISDSALAWFGNHSSDSMVFNELQDSLMAIHSIHFFVVSLFMSSYILYLQITSYRINDLFIYCTNAKPLTMG